jgi:Flp pilus assembly pilin Flp
MFHMLKKLWNDEAGLVLSAELVFVASILSIGMIVGLSAARDGVTSELGDVGDAITEYNQGWQLAGIVGHGASVAGSQYIDNLDYCDPAADDNSTDDANFCVARNITQVNEVDPATVPSQIP